MTELITAALMGAAILSVLWTSRIWIFFLLATVVSGYWTGVFTGTAAVWLGALALACRAYTIREMPSKTWLYAARGISGCAIVGLSLALGLHLLAGFHNWNLVPPQVLTPGAMPYEVWVIFDKTLAGVIVMGLVCKVQLPKGEDLLKSIRLAIIPTAVTIVTVILFSVLLRYVQWDPKWTSQFWLWGAVNLLTACMSEEVFFRAFLQTQIAHALRNFPLGATAAVVVSGVLFGAAHFAGGWTYAVLASVAGVGYGIVFERTKRVEASIMSHFALNATHFVLFTYPRLA